MFTSDADRNLNLNINQQPLANLPNYPEQYAKFVYCLAYGEKSLTNADNHPLRDGTPQFWKIFYSCLNEVNNNQCFAPILRMTPTEQRITNKINVLASMRERGIWLVDASIAAVYGNDVNLTSNTKRQTILASWLGYTRNVIIAANPKHVIVVGKGVYDAIQNHLPPIMENNHTVIPQPQARLPTIEHLANFRSYYNICNG